VSNKDIKIFPILPEALGLFLIPPADHIIYKDIAQKIIDNPEERFQSTNIGCSTLKHVCNQKDQNIFKNFPQLQNLEKTLSEFILKYIRSIGFCCEEVVITDAWLNCAMANSSQALHLHSNSFISGTYYINFLPNVHAPLTIANDRLMQGTARHPFLELPIDQEVSTAYNQRQLRISIEESSVLLWKSHILHGWDNNNADNRITLSFNAMPKVCSDGYAYSFSVGN